MAHLAHTHTQRLSNPYQKRSYMCHRRENLLTTYTLLSLLSFHNIFVHSLSLFPQVYCVCSKFTKAYVRAMKRFRWKRLNASQTPPMPSTFWKHSKSWIDGVKNLLSWTVPPIWPKILWCIMYEIYHSDDVLTIICLVVWWVFFSFLFCLFDPLILWSSSRRMSMSSDFLKIGKTHFVLRWAKPIRFLYAAWWGLYILFTNEYSKTDNLKGNKNKQKFRFSNENVFCK